MYRLDRQTEHSGLRLKESRKPQVNHTPNHSQFDPRAQTLPPLTQPISPVSYSHHSYDGYIGPSQANFQPPGYPHSSQQMYSFGQPGVTNTTEAYSNTAYGAALPDRGQDEQRRHPYDSYGSFNEFSAYGY